MKTFLMMVGIILALAAAGGGARAQEAAAALGPEALKADPWTSPPRTAQETQAAVAALRTQYAPYLRSLPEKFEPRQRRDLGGAWRSKFEVRNATDGKRPDPPDWFREDLSDGAWEETTVPEWRWSPVKNGNRWYPASCILWYRTRFEAPPAPAGRRVFLCFAGVDWEAEVWLNGKLLGRHTTYYEPFRFDVTGLLREKNTLAVRVSEGPLFGEPMSQWSLLPFVPGDPGEDQHYVMGDRAKSFPNDKFGSTSSLGSGFGIHREVTLETTGEACVTGLFARGDPAAGQARVSVETDAAAAKDLTLEVQILPENFEGRAYQKTERVSLARGAGKHTLALAMPGAKAWWPAEPNLYRCRAILRDGDRVVDARDALFGCRSFGVVSPGNPRPGLAEGTFLLNGRPVFLRGTNLSGALNAYWYWGQQDNLLKAALMIKAANFNAVRCCQHVSFPEVRELFDRLGIMSEQDQGAGFELGADVPATLAALARTGTALARTCYNNAGVVLLSFANETRLDVTAVVGNALAVDPERIIVPISGGAFTLTNPQYRDHVVADSHPYEGWYQGVHVLWESARTRPPVRLMTLGEYGAEALDAYETMRRYPKQWGAPPALNEDKLWGSRQVGTGMDLRQQFGFRGKTPANLGQYIEASQNYQADVLAEATKGFRISKAAIGGYFQFHFLDGTAAQWPKAIVSHDFLPKKGYYEMAQANQPLVPLYRMIDRGRTMEVWVANDLPTTLTGCTVSWVIRAGDRRIDGEAATDVPASGAVLCRTVDLKELPVEAEVLDVALALADGRGLVLSRYEREVYRSFKFVEDGKAQAAVEALKKSLGKKKNLAAGKPVTATSAAAGAAPALAVDGGTRTGWQAEGNKLPQSLTVDLGRSAALAGARVVWQGGAERQVEFQLSDDGRQWRPVSGKPRNATLKVHRAPLIFLDQFFVFGGAGRYVRITIDKVSDGSAAGFNELEIYEK